MSDMSGRYDPHLGQMSSVESRDHEPKAYGAPVMQEDGRIVTLIFETYELALAACHKFEIDVAKRARPG